MAEKLTPNLDNQEKLAPKLESEHQENTERLRQQAELEASKAEEIKDLTEIQSEVAKEALSSEETTLDQEPKEVDQPSLGAQQQLKNDSYKRTMNKVRQELNPAERRFSKVIHNPVVETISDISGKTIARPSAIIGAGLLSLVGSSAVLYMSKHYGFSYNTFTFFGLFAIGFFIGIAIEQGLRLIKR